MSIDVRHGDLVSLDEGILVHGCNCMGKMNSGIAKSIRAKWPATWSAYERRHQTCELQLGDVIFVGNPTPVGGAGVRSHLHEVSNQLPSNIIVANAMTQFYYGRDKRVVYVDYDAVFAAFARIRLLARFGLTVNFPMIGCGLGNGQWQAVAEAIEAAMGTENRLVLWEMPT